jgi:hypothetical protein
MTDTDTGPWSSVRALHPGRRQSSTHATIQPAVTTTDSKVNGSTSIVIGSSHL